MKTAISIPNTLFEKLEATRKRLRLSRSEALQGALAKWLELNEGQNITSTINAALDKLGDAAKLEPEVELAGIGMLEREVW